MKDIVIDMKLILILKKDFENKGMIFSGLSPDNKLPEIIELNDHPWFIGVQFHPEFKSRPLTPHPLFSSFIKAAKINSKKMKIIKLNVLILKLLMINHLL